MPPQKLNMAYLATDQSYDDIPSHPSAFLNDTLTRFKGAPVDGRACQPKAYLRHHPLEACF